MKTVELLFWIALLLVFYTYLGYGLLLAPAVWLRERIRPRRAAALPDELPRVTLVIAAYNEEAVVDVKMRNCLALDYPADRLRILWVTDGSTDGTNERLAAWPRADVLFEPARRGKTAALNRSIGCIDTPLVIYTDANTMLNPEAVREIVRRFDDPAVGCVAGEKRVRPRPVADSATTGTRNDGADMPSGDPDKTRTGSGATPTSDAGGTSVPQANAAATEGLYWRYESLLKQGDDRLHTAVGAAGELFAVRRELYRPLPEDTLLDDFVLSMRIARAGYRIAYCNTAWAEEEPSADMREEGKRKTRIAAGGLQSVWRLRGLLLPWPRPLLWWQYLSHRVLRWTLAPLMLALLLPLNIVLVAGSPHRLLYGFLLACQLLFYAAALVGYLSARRGRNGGLCAVPYYFLFMNLHVSAGIVYLCRHKGNGAWEKARRA